MSTTMKVLGDPKGMRPADRRFALSPSCYDTVGEYELDGGRVVWVTWLPTGSTHTHIVVWDEAAILSTRFNVVRVQAAPTTEKLLRELEAPVRV